MLVVDMFVNRIASNTTFTPLEESWTTSRKITLHLELAGRSSVAIVVK